jgi:hypothetical protein
MKRKEQRCIVLFVLLFVGLSVFSFGQTSNGVGNGKSIRITGLDPKYVGVWSCGLYNSGDDASSIGVWMHDGRDPYSFSDGIATIRLIVGFMWENADDHLWNGSGSYYVRLTLSESGGDRDWYVSKNKISFDNAITEVSFADFNFIKHTGPFFQ